ncbi:histidine kinase [Dyadobacter chenwenxiniae]|uniref:sensor histidine kinase n=1 Tax=Dyadobacter chenwenxiniae TaxID=2906456 RepID=UPI001FD4B994|nr:histidine kinase [Dyadobacter chenwenxiniae]UON85386.1 histidine kinase [Dyadobacter chenwenxiniae]
MMFPTISLSAKNWFFRYKLYHLPFWFLYHYLWWAVSMGNAFKPASSLTVLPYAIKFSFYFIFQALAVYFNLYYLIPRYLEKSRFAAYVGLLLSTMVATTLFIISGYYFSSYVSGRSLSELYGGGNEAECFYRFLNNALPSTVASMTLAMSIKLTKSWIQTQRKQQALEKEKLETELEFLKNQFNPHFLFNTINSIFFLIHKNPDMASDALAKFSELLRYQLYECNDLQIPLHNEITYIENFIELEKLRQNDNIDIALDLDRRNTHLFGIAPFLLMIFVENAFKHVSKHASGPNWIRIKLKMEGGKLDFSVSNSTSPFTTRDIIYYGGIGLKNVQRRLDLIYPEQYDLQIKEDNVQFDLRLLLCVSELVPAQGDVPVLNFNS